MLTCTYCQRFAAPSACPPKWNPPLADSSWSTPFDVDARLGRVARVGARPAATRPRGAASKSCSAETGHRAASSRARPARRPGSRCQSCDESCQASAPKAWRFAERHRGAGLDAPRPRLRIGTERAAARELGRGAKAHALVRGQRASRRRWSLLRQRALVAIARGREALGAFQRPPVVAVVCGRRQSSDRLRRTSSSPSRSPPASSAHAEHLAAAHVLRLEREVAAEHAGAAPPSLR